MLSYLPLLCLYCLQSFFLVANSALCWENHSMTRKAGLKWYLKALWVARFDIKLDEQRWS